MNRLFRSVTMLFFLLGWSAWADEGSDQTIEKFCQNDIEQLERCCHGGDCEIKDSIVNYALVLDVEEVRPMRHWCFLTRGAVAPTCPGGKLMQQRTYFLKGDKSGESNNLLTRVLMFSVVEEKKVKTANEPVFELIKAQHKVCLKEIDALMNSSDTTFAKNCSREVYRPKLVALREKVNFELMGLLVNADRRKKMNGEFVDPYLKNFVKNSCPQLEKWHGVFQRSLYAPNTENLVHIKKTLGPLLSEKWGPLTAADEVRLTSRECLTTESATLRCSEQPLPELNYKIPCDGQLHYIAEKGPRPPTGPPPASMKR